MRARRVAAHGQRRRVVVADRVTVLGARRQVAQRVVVVALDLLRDAAGEALDVLQPVQRVVTRERLVDALIHVLAARQIAERVEVVIQILDVVAARAARASQRVDPRRLRHVLDLGRDPVAECRLLKLSRRRLRLLREVRLQRRDVRDRRQIPVGVVVVAHLQSRRVCRARRIRHDLNPSLQIEVDARDEAPLARDAGRRRIRPAQIVIGVRLGLALG